MKQSKVGENHSDYKTTPKKRSIRLASWGLFWWQVEERLVLICFFFGQISSANTIINNPFHKGMRGIQTTNPYQQLIISWFLRVSRFQRAFVSKGRDFLGVWRIGLLHEDDHYTGGTGGVFIPAEEKIHLFRVKRDSFRNNIRKKAAGKRAALMSFSWPF